MTEQEKREKVIKAFEFCLMPPNREEIENDVCSHEDCPYYREYNGWKCISAAVSDALALLKAQEAVEPHYTKLEYTVNGMPYVVHHPECPRCIENGLILWDAEIERGAAYCKRCGQAVKWE